MSEYILYCEGEEFGRYTTRAQLSETLLDIRNEYVAESQREAELYPDEFEPGFDHYAAAREWMEDVYELTKTLPLWN